MTAWNQQGCLSPHVIYVEHGGTVPPEQFAELLAEELERRRKRNPGAGCPPGRPPRLPRDAPSMRSVPPIRPKPASGTARVPPPGRWSMKLTRRLQVSCLNRFIYVKGLKDLSEPSRAGTSFEDTFPPSDSPRPNTRPQAVATVARWGVARARRLGRMQQPPADLASRRPTRAR